MLHHLLFLFQYLLQKKNVQKQVCAPVYNDRKIELNKVPDFIQNNKPFVF